MTTLSLRALTGAVALAGVALVAAVAPASAGDTWHQEYQRSGSDAPCPAPAAETPWQPDFTGQQEWSGSWAAWPNEGHGGWVCQRSIIWYRTPSATNPSPQVGPGCIWILNGPFSNSYSFVTGVYLPPGSPVYLSADCSGLQGETSTGTAYAPDDQAAALAICAEHGYTSVIGRDNGIWSCSDL